MKNEEAIETLEAMAMAESTFSDEESKKCCEAIDLAVEALKQEEASLGEPLTLEQLMEKDGEPVFYKSLVENKSGWAIIRIVKLQKEWIIELHGMLQKVSAGKDTYEETWLAYAYSPSRLDLNSWEQCGYCANVKYIYGNATAVVPNEDNRQIETYMEGDFGYCPVCGCPITEEARAELEKRLRG